MIRTAIKTDLPQILDCLKSLSSVEYEKFSDIEMALEDRNESGNIFTFVYEGEIGGQKLIMGVLTLRVEYKLSHGGKCCTDIQDVAVNKKYQMKGVGEALMNYAIQYSKDIKAYKVSLQCKEPLRKYYSRFGFTYCDVCEMRKDL